MPTMRPRWRCTRSSVSRAPACSAVSPIATVTGPTPSWYSARSVPASPRRRPSRRPAARPSRRKVSRSDLDAVGMQGPVVQCLVLAKPRLRPLSGFVLVGSVDLERALAHLDLPAVLAEHVLHEPDHIS